ncbi:putative serine aminopeptidase, S33 [Lyophyllum shimeji]|uniref:Serine aminopeptidase, S33 n=1 Tax=Lyophyllum shimeji TaxID=47721 RepID=A0A9P3UIF7_LYOSH|nr:putative serine aminopeptidase, S33 [Lyophyllum shimeji]
MATKFVSVPGNIKAAYRQVPEAPNPANPTLVLLHSFTTTHELFEPQFNDQELTSRVNLLAIDELGHGQTENPLGWSYWTQAQMALDDALHIPKVYALGTSQGGFIAARMWMLRADKVLGIIPVGSSMYSESDETRKLGAWNAPKVFPPWYDAFVSTRPKAEFEVPRRFTDDLIHYGFGEAPTKEQHEFWTQRIRDTYKGDEGRKKLLMCTICLEQRDSLELKLPEVTCPVLAIHGTKDGAYPLAVAQKYAEQLVNSAFCVLKVVQEGRNFLTATHPKETDKLVLNWIQDREGKR